MEILFALYLLNADGGSPTLVDKPLTKTMCQAAVKNAISSDHFAKRYVLICIPVQDQ